MVYIPSSKIYFSGNFSRIFWNEGGLLYLLLETLNWFSDGSSFYGFYYWSAYYFHTDDGSLLLPIDNPKFCIESYPAWILP